MAKKRVGDWQWNSDVLYKKIVGEDITKCWTWIGSTGPQTNLFGAKKNGKPQMTQARRILHMDVTNEPVDDYRITMKCKNAYCMNWTHFEVKPNQRRYYDDGTERGQREEQDPTTGLKRVKLKQIKADWE